LKEQGKSKLVARDLDRKIEALTAKNYSSMISKIQGDLSVLKEENTKLLTLYQSKLK
jgi:hypothetical protein